MKSKEEILERTLRIEDVKIDDVLGATVGSIYKAMERYAIEKQIEVLEGIGTSIDNMNYYGLEKIISELKTKLKSL